VTNQSARHRDLVTAALAAVALTQFARLALRHVGESYFLADQVDVLQKFEAFQRLEPEGLWGSVMSGSAAHALGPFGAIVFGLPVALGLGIDGIHATTSVFLVVATGVAFWQLARLDATFAWLWLTVMTGMRMVWWDAAMFWVNTVLLPLGLLLLALCAALVRRPSLPILAGMTLVLLLALQEHLVALVGVPIQLAGMVLYVSGSGAGRTWSRPPRPRDALYFGLVLAIGLLPYVVAEAQTGFQNSRAMFSHVGSAVHSSSADGRRAAAETLVLAADPLALWPASLVQPLVMGGGIAFAALVGLIAGRRGGIGPDPSGQSSDERWRLRTLSWLVTCALVGVIGQALFFLVMARPLNGLHYAILLAPWYAVPPAALAAGLLPHRGAAATLTPAVLGVAAILLLVFRAPGLADFYAERTPWNYRAIVTALDSLCGDQTVDTIEGPGLRNELTAGYDSVLRYLMKRGYTRCRYQAGSRIVIAADRSGHFDDALDVEGRRFRREQVVPPGLARYRAP
jgi:hypothetical protein